MRAVAFVISVGIAACGSSSSDGGGEVNSQAGLHAFMDAIALDLVATFTDLASSGKPVVPANPATCKDGGSVRIVEGMNVIMFNDCVMRGVTVNGSCGALISRNSANLSGGTIVLTGAYTGTVMIVSGLLSWELPVADATTYWMVTARIGGMTVCAYSGGDECPTH